MLHFSKYTSLQMERGWGQALVAKRSLPFIRWPHLVVWRSCCVLRLSVDHLWKLIFKLCDGLKGRGCLFCLFPFSFCYYFDFWDITRELMLFFRVTRLYVCVMHSQCIYRANVYGMLDTVVGTSLALLFYFVFFTFVLNSCCYVEIKKKEQSPK